MAEYILVIDEGTTSTRAMAFDRAFREIARAQSEVALHFPRSGWVEQDGEDVWTRTLSVCRKVIAEVGGADKIAAIGITNQRETTLAWEREGVRLLAPAIVWQDRRTAAACERLRAGEGTEDFVRERTGLLIDPYFSATKIAWLLEHVEGARARAQEGEIVFGTVDTFLIWRLTGGRVFASDVTNASRTNLWTLGPERPHGWDAGLMDVFGATDAALGAVLPSAGDFGETDPALFGRAIPILSAIGDQQAALVGQGCVTPGMAKITYGTGAFLVANTGGERVRSEHRLLATMGYATAGGAAAYALEGSVFNTGTVVKWLRDELRLIPDAADTEAMAASLDDNGGVYFVPAFTGLGAPHWDADARGVICGLSRGTRAAHIVRAGLEAAAFQTRDLIEAFGKDGVPVEVLRVDGGMAANDWLMQFLADICAVPVERPDYGEMTALGAAVLAGVQLGWTSLDAWGRAERPGRRFEPAMDAGARAAALDGWQAALARTRLSGEAV